jgi:Tfp pilus assembly protein PilN
MRFDFLSDAPPDFIDRLRNVRITSELRTPLSALLTAALVVMVWWGLERYWLVDAQREERIASSRLLESRADLAATRVARSGVEQLLSLDRRLRQVRISGSVLGAMLSDIGNHVPPHAWLTSLSKTHDGVEIVGRADGLGSLSQTVADLMSSRIGASPGLVRASRDQHGKSLFTFAVAVENKNAVNR